MTDNHHRKIFMETIKRLSVVPTDYLKEWSITDCKEPNIPYPHEGEDDDWICECKMENRKPSHKRCICKQHIDNFYTLKNKVNDTVIWIGVDCAKKFLGIISPENTCMECEKHIRKNKTNLCKKCESHCILKFGKYKGYTFHTVFKNDKRYCLWVECIAEPTGKLKSFKNWLEKR